jgi:hypothetical protein
MGKRGANARTKEAGDDDRPRSDDEIARRRDDALRRALSMPSPRERARPSADRVQKDTDRRKERP